MYLFLPSPFSTHFISAFAFAIDEHLCASVRLADFNPKVFFFF
jgi:hypothetical protein